MKRYNYAVDFTVQQLLAANVHLGHRSSRVDQRMFEFLIGARLGIYLINLVKSVRIIKPAISVLVRVIARRGRVLFANLGPQFVARLSLENRRFCYRYFFVNRKLPGILTNFTWLRQFYKGLRISNQIPSYCVATNSYDHHAVREADYLNIPAFGVFDSDTNPYGYAFYTVPGNDDSFNSRLLYYKLAFRAIKVGFRYYVVQWNLKRRGHFKGRFNMFSKYLFFTKYFKSDASNFYGYKKDLVRDTAGLTSLAYFAKFLRHSMDLDDGSLIFELLTARNGTLNFKFDHNYADEFCIGDTEIERVSLRELYEPNPWKSKLIRQLNLSYPRSKQFRSNRCVESISDIIILFNSLIWLRAGGSITLGNRQDEWVDGEQPLVFLQMHLNAPNNFWLKEIGLRAFNFRRSKVFGNDYLLSTIIARARTTTLALGKLRYLYLRKILSENLVFVPAAILKETHYAGAIEQRKPRINRIFKKKMDPKVLIKEKKLRKMRAAIFRVKSK